MSGKWKTPNEVRPGVLRFAELAVRAEKLLVAHRLDRLSALISSQTRALQQKPGGPEALAEAHQHLAQAKLLLRGKSNG
jgi:hypothetical protein